MSYKSLFLYSGVTVFALTAILIVASFWINDHQTTPTGKAVEIIYSKGKYELLRNGKPFIIKGACGTEHLDLLHASGGNAIRIYDTAHLYEILESAHKNNIAVIVGLPMIESWENSYYENSGNLTKQYTDFKALVNRYKSHPALLMWCAGNELKFPFTILENKDKFYTHFNRVVDMIKRDDPDHPVTTTVDQKRDIFNILTRTNVDVVSLNIFGSINSLRRDLKWLSWFWRGSYLITEWGIDGPWIEEKQTAWGAIIEPSSSGKAEQYFLRYRNAMPQEDPRFLGSFVFYWGSKQEVTHTWFSLFDDTGGVTESIDVLKKLWANLPDSPNRPKLNYIVIKGRTDHDNIIESANSVSDAQVVKISGNIAKVKWELYKEDWYQPQYRYNQKRLKPLQS
jgi:hypothetical protein